MEKYKTTNSNLYLNNEIILGIEGFVNINHVIIREKIDSFIFIFVNLFLFIYIEKIIISKIFYFILILCILINLITNIYYYKKSKNYKKEIKIELIINIIFKISYILIIISLFIKSYLESLLIIPNVLVLLYSFLLIRFEFIFLDINFKLMMTVQILLFKFQIYSKIFSNTFLLIPTMLVTAYFITNLILYIILAFMSKFKKNYKSLKIFLYLSLYYLWCISQVFILFFVILNYFDKTKYYIFIKILSSANILLLVLLIFLLNKWKDEVKKLNEILYYSSLEKKIKLINFSPNQEKIFYKLSSNYLSYTNININNKENENNIDLKQKIDNISNNSLCLGCFEKIPKIAVDPCNHLVFCISCLKNFIIYNKGECPICKIIINKYHKVKSISDNRYKLNGEITVN